jgi:RHS repeat-associated protein
MNVTGTLEQPFQFSTKRYDAGTGLNYYGYRFYAPAIERWLNRDPIGEAGGINLYGFVLNDPVNWVDPEGRSVTAVFGAIIIGNTILEGIDYLTDQYYKYQTFKALEEQVLYTKKLLNEPNISCERYKILKERLEELVRQQGQLGLKAGVDLVSQTYNWVPGHIKPHPHHSTP